MSEQPPQPPVFTSAYDYLNAQLNQAGALLALAMKDYGGHEGKNLSFSGQVSMAESHANLAKAGALVALAQEVRLLSEGVSGLLEVLTHPERTVETAEEPEAPQNPAQDLLGRVQDRAADSPVDSRDR